MLPLLSALLLGVVAGLRSMTAPAAVAWGAGLGYLALGGTWADAATRPAVRYVLLALMLGELVADKLPFTPSRTKAGPFAGRVASGALCGAALGTPSGRAALGALLGAAGAVAGTLGGFRARARLARTFGRDLPAALVEDAVALAVAALAVLGAR
jgi:uncharacterized membrane protein